MPENEKPPAKPVEIYCIYYCLYEVGGVGLSVFFRAVENSIRKKIYYVGGGADLFFLDVSAAFLLFIDGVIWRFRPEGGVVVEGGNIPRRARFFVLRI